MLQRRDDWVDNTYTATINETEFEGYKDFAGRFQLQYDDGPFDALLNLHVRDLRGTARLFRANIIKRGTNDFVDSFEIDKAAQNGSNPQTLDQIGISARLSYGFDGLGTLYSVTSYERVRLFSRGDIDGGFGSVSTPPFGPGTIPFSSETGSVHQPREFSQEFRFASDQVGKFRFQGGLYYFESKLNSMSYAWSPANVRSFTQSADIKNRSYAGFASVEFTPTDDLIFRGGVRYTRDKKEGRRSTAALSIPAETSGNNISWDGSATYKVTPDLSFYGRVARGYLAPTLRIDTGGTGLISFAKGQTTTSYEAGLKGSVVDSRLSFSLAGFYNNTRDIQLSAIGGTSNVTRLLNARRAVGYGVEADLRATPVPNLNLTVGGSYNFTQIRDADVTVAVCGNGCTVLDPRNINGRAIIDRNPLPYAPRFVFSWTARYAVPLSSKDELFAYTDWSYRGKQRLFLYDAVEYRQKSLMEGGLRVGYRSDAQGLEIAGFVRNILDQVRITGALDFNNLTGFTNDPRTFGIEIRKSF